LPIALTHYEMTGPDDGVALLWNTPPIQPAAALGSGAS
jgi:hypothetical protein